MRNIRQLTLEDLRGFDPSGKVNPDNPLVEPVTKLAQGLAALFTVIHETPDDLVQQVAPQFINIAEQGIANCHRAYQERRSLLTKDLPNDQAE